MPLIGVHVQYLEPENNFYRLGIFRNHVNQYPLKILHHDSRQVIDQWIVALKEEARTFAFEDKYKYINEIGKGFFSHVIKCRNRLTSETVAVKKISKKNMSEQNKKFIREEISIGISINHPNVVQIKEIFESEYYVYIVMEHIGGGDLHKYLKTYVTSEQ